MVMGITGHQKIGSAATVAWVRIQLRAAIKNYQPELGLTSLAVGADQLFASVLDEFKIRYEAIIPSRKYRESFSSRARLAFDRYLERADKVSCLPFEEPSERAFYEAGKAVTNGSDILIAVWNGLPAKGLGGTADIVRYAQRSGKPVIHIDPVHRVCNLL